MPEAKRLASAGEIANPEQLRGAIDRGRTGDKVRVADPAAAPLGTDEEAGGTPPTPEQVAAAAQMEMARHTRQPGSRASNAVLVAAVLLTLVVTIAAILATRQ